jgi:hypothetical protein
VKKTDNTVVDAKTQTMRCEKCGDEVPIPFGCIPWVSAVMTAFADAHAGDGPHTHGRTRFSVPNAGREGTREINYD